MVIVLIRRRWYWIGILHRGITNISKVTVRCTPKGKGKSGRPKSTLRRAEAVQSSGSKPSLGTILKPCGNGSTNENGESLLILVSCTMLGVERTDIKGAYVTGIKILKMFRDNVFLWVVFSCLPLISEQFRPKICETSVT